MDPLVVILHPKVSHHKVIRASVEEDLHRKAIPWVQGGHPIMVPLMVQGPHHQMGRPPTTVVVHLTATWEHMEDPQEEAPVDLLQGPQILQRPQALKLVLLAANFPRVLLLTFRNFKTPSMRWRNVG